MSLSPNEFKSKPTYSNTLADRAWTFLYKMCPCQHPPNCSTDYITSLCFTVPVGCPLPCVYRLTGGCVGCCVGPVCVMNNVYTCVYMCATGSGGIIFVTAISPPGLTQFPNGYHTLAPSYKCHSTEVVWTNINSLWHPIFCRPCLTMFGHSLAVFVQIFSTNVYFHLHVNVKWHTDTRHSSHVQSVSSCAVIHYLTWPAWHQQPMRA
jgi:hypothetical protein